MSVKGGHTHPKSLHAPIGFVFLSLSDLGTGPIECFGRTFYKANGANGTTDLMGRFPRMTNAPLTTGGADSHTLTVNEMPSHTHTTQIASAASGDLTWFLYSSHGGTHDHAKENIQARGGGAAHENRPAFIEMIPYQAVS